MPKKARRFSRETKIVAVRRMLAGESVAALSRELNILRKDLYKWRAGFLSGGPQALRNPGRPRQMASAERRVENTAAQYDKIESAQRRIAKLEEKVREQESELRNIRERLGQAVGAPRPHASMGARKPRPSRD
jgi:transposase-like protein